LSIVITASFIGEETLCPTKQDYEDAGPEGTAGGSILFHKHNKVPPNAEFVKK